MISSLGQTNVQGNVYTLLLIIKVGYKTEQSFELKIPHYKADHIMRTQFKTRVHKPHPISDQNGKKTIPFGAAHTYIAHIKEYLPPLGFLILSICFSLCINKTCPCDLYSDNLLNVYPQIIEMHLSALLVSIISIFN